MTTFGDPAPVESPHENSTHRAARHAQQTLDGAVYKAAEMTNGPKGRDVSARTSRGDSEMADNKQQQQPQHQQQGNRQDSPKPESASKPGKRGYDERERDRASHPDQSRQDNARGDRNPGNFQDNPNKGGQR